MFLDLIIYIILFYISKQLIVSFIFDHVITLALLMSLKKIFIVLLALIIIDLIYDIIIAFKEGLKKVKNDIIRMVSIIIISALVVCTNNYLLNSNDPYKISDRILNKIDEENYVPISQEAGILEKKIYDTYGIKVFSNIDPFSLMNTDEYSGYIDGNDAEHFERYLQVIYDELKIYSEEALKVIPKCIFLVSDIDGDSAAGLNYNRTSPRSNFIVFSVLDNLGDYAKVTVHHEIFHTLNVYTDENILKEFDENGEACNITSEYACTSPVEFIAESWAYKIARDLNTEHSKILGKTFDTFIKDFKQAGNSLNHEELLQLEEEMLIINNFDEDYFKDIIYTSSNYLMEESYHFVNDDNKAIIYKDHPVLYGELKEKVEIKCEEIINSFKSEGIMKVLNIYEYLLNDLEEDEDLVNEIWYYISNYYGADTFSQNEIKNIYLYNILYKLGYNVYLRYNLDSGFYVEMNYNNITYFFDLKLERINLGLYQGFMLCAEDLKFYYPDIKALNYFEFENDRSFSDYDSILLLEDFNQEKIDNFLISVLKKYKFNSKLYIICKDEIICDEVESYLKFNTGRSLVQTIYNRYVNSTYYPGYWYMVGDDIIAIYDLY